MKRIVLASLSVLLLAAATPAAKAETTAMASPVNVQSVQPFNLVSLAYQGFFADAGIPKYNRLVDAYARGQVGAEDLVRVAIAQNRLPANAISDTGYIKAVDNQLRMTVRDAQTN